MTYSPNEKQRELQVQAEINKGKSIVLPTVPSSVLTEIQHRRKSKETQDSSEAFMSGANNGGINNENMAANMLAEQQRLFAQQQALIEQQRRILERQQQELEKKQREFELKQQLFAAESQRANSIASSSEKSINLATSGIEKLNLNTTALNSHQQPDPFDFDATFIKNAVQASPAETFHNVQPKENVQLDPFDFSSLLSTSKGTGTSSPMRPLAQASPIKATPVFEQNLDLGFDIDFNSDDFFSADLKLPGSTSSKQNSNQENDADDDFWKVDEDGVDDYNPLDAFENRTRNGAETAEDIEVAKRAQEEEDETIKRLEVKRREQEIADAEFAKRLQTEEYTQNLDNRTVPNRYDHYGSNYATSGSGFRSYGNNMVAEPDFGYHGREDNISDADYDIKRTQASLQGKQETRITLTARELREMAEEEIGKDNVRIMAGFSVIKYGREGRPHQRKMWINSALTHLAWESNQLDGSHRGLELNRVTRIQVGQMTRTIGRSTRDYKKVKNLCFSLETSQRTLDLQACSVIQRDTLVAALKKVVEFNHIHKPDRRDKHRTEITVYID